MDALPLTAGRWQLDATRSSINFTVRHLGLTNVRGHFNGFDAYLDVHDTLESTVFGATIDITTIDTDEPDRDAQLRSSDLFCSDDSPTMTFVSMAITARGSGQYAAAGDLSINGVKRPATLDVELTGATVPPGEHKEQVGFIATTRIARDDFGIGFSTPLGLDRLVLGNKVDIEIDIGFTLPR